MDKFIKILLKLLFPPIILAAILVPVATAMVIYALIFEESASVLAIVSYVLSAYALAIVCARAPRIFKKVKTVKEENKYIQRYTSDAHLRVKLSLYSSVALNTLYALMQVISGIVNQSFWFYSLAIYYALLAIMRYFVLRDTVSTSPGVNRASEWQRYRFCGIILLFMNLALALMVFFIVYWNRGFQYHYIQTIAMAAYTFTAMTMAVVNVVKYRRFESPLMSAAKAVSLAAALVSMLSLETAMLTAFGQENGPVFRQLMTLLTGLGVVAVVLAIALYMIVHATKQLKSIEKGETDNESTE